METLNISLSDLTFSQKLDLMETLWDDISNSTNQLESPGWHREVLQARKQTITSGKAVISDWEEAKHRIRNNI